jgi:hypothetical protein
VLSDNGRERIEMSVEENKAIVRSIVERAWNQGDLTVIDERVSEG